MNVTVNKGARLFVIEKYIYESFGYYSNRPLTGLFNDVRNNGGSSIYGKG